MIRIGSFPIIAIASAWLAMRGIDYGTFALYGRQTERETRYSAFVDCMVKTSSGWGPRNELRTAQ